MVVLVIEAHFRIVVLFLSLSQLVCVFLFFGMNDLIDVTVLNSLAKSINIYRYKLYACIDIWKSGTNVRIIRTGC